MLRTHMDEVDELQLGFELKPAEKGLNTTKSKLESLSCDPQNTDLMSSNLMNVVESDTDPISNFEVNRVTHNVTLNLKKHKIHNPTNPVFLKFLLRIINRFFNLM